MYKVQNKYVVLNNVQKHNFFYKDTTLKIIFFAGGQNERLYEILGVQY